MTVDNDVHAPHAVERFGLGDLGHAAEIIFYMCLARKNELGAVRLGEGKNVVVRLVRVDKEYLLVGGSNGGLQEAAVGNGSLLMSSLFSAMSGSRSSS